MKKIILAAATLFCFAGFNSQAQTTPSKTYGAQFEQTSTYSPGRLDVLLKDKKEIKNIGMAGVISEVCQAEGCWFKMNTNENTSENLMVKTKDHSFLLPKDLAGKRVLAQGTVTKKTMSVKEQQHYLEDSGASAEEIAAITEPKETYVMIAEGVQVF